NRCAGVYASYSFRGLALQPVYLSGGNFDRREIGKHQGRAAGVLIFESDTELSVIEISSPWCIDAVSFRIEEEPRSLLKPRCGRQLPPVFSRDTAPFHP